MGMLVMLEKSEPGECFIECNYIFIVLIIVGVDVVGKGKELWLFSKV